MQTLRAFIEAQEIECEVEYAESNPNRDDWPAGSRHFLVTLSNDQGSVSTPFSQGLAVDGEPDAADVLNSLALDIRALQDEGDDDGVKMVVALGGTIESTADVDDARTTEKAIKASRAGLEHMLGADAFEHLLYGVESL